MDELAQERNQLKQQVEYLSKCQWPREMALWPPDRLTYGRKMREEIRLVNLQRPAGAVLKGQSQGPGSLPAPGSGLPVPAGLSRAKSEGAGPEELGGAMSGVEGTDDEDDENPNMVTENVNTRGDKWDLDKLVGKWKAYVKEDRMRRAPWTMNQQNHSGINGAGVSASPATDGLAKGTSHLHSATAANGTGGSPGLSATTGSGEGEGLGIRKDKKPFGKDNNVTIISDW